MDRAGHDYWSKGWDDVSLLPMHDLSRPTLHNRIDFEYFQVFRRLFSGKGKLSVIELGCGNSIWLPYLRKYFDADISGLDYTETGCRTARALLDHYGLQGDIIQGDIFDPPAALKQKFDIVFSNGVVEHFEDTAHCLRHCAAFMKPDGHMVTFIPNLGGWLGSIQKFGDRKIYDIHVPQDLEFQKEMHKKAGLEILESGYLMPLNLYMLNLAQHKSKPWYIFIRATISLVTRFVWILEGLNIRLPRNKALSAYIYVIARQP
jgi:2-polyprenyl-3-methyl-5-hydroxy-6-metoxy-1,4-benzoquinol methylase